jgi:xeroderma pigmentosum group C-complementing protein
VRTRPWDEVQAVIDKLAPLTRADLLPQALFDKEGSSKDAEKAMEEKLAQYEPGTNGERLRSINSLMKRAVLQNGSRDVSAILFVSLCRACGLGTRLVVNLQAVPWRAEKVVPKKMSGETKGGRTVASRQGNGDDDEDEDSMEEVEIPDPASNPGGPGAVMDKIKAKREKNAIRQAGRRRHQDPADVYRLKKPKPAPQTPGGVIKKTKPKLGKSSSIY